MKSWSKNDDSVGPVQWLAQMNSQQQQPQQAPVNAPRGRLHPERAPHPQQGPQQPHLHLEVERGIADGILIVGEFDVIKWTKSIGFARAPHWLPRDVAIQEGVSGRGGALPGDIVAVELFPQSQWQSKPDPRQDGDTQHVPTLGTRDMPARLADGREVHFVLRHDEAPPSSRAVRISMALGARPPTNWPPGIQPQGVIVSVLERHFEQFHACRPLDSQANNRIVPDRFYKFKPYNEKFPVIAVYGRDIPSELWGDLSSHLVLVQVGAEGDSRVRWVDETFPIGRVCRSLGKAGTADAESRAIATRFHCPSEEFDEEVEKCVPPAFAVPPPEELKRTHRRDLREEEFICTIDPASARDLDDALSCTRTRGGYRVGVHIADVSFFVPAQSALDEEAKRRCTSTYFVEKVIPMLPRKLSEHYCSLNPGEDKFAFSVLWNVSSRGEILTEWFGQTVIRSSCRMAYEDAQRIIDGDESCSALPFCGGEAERISMAAKVVDSVKNLYYVAKILRDMRKDRGAVWLSRGKMRFFFEDFNSKLAPKGFAVEGGKEANWLVEEFMLLANCRVAEKIVQFLPDCSMLRKHDSPDRKKIQMLVECARRNGYEISASGSRALNDSLHRYDGDPHSDLLRTMAIYSMKLAQYISSGEDAQQSIRHYALAVPVYTHFTSPIRRYCDVVVHRQLLLALEIESLFSNLNPEHIDVSSLHHAQYYLSPSEVALIAEKCNERKEAARNASSESSKMFFCLYLEALRQKSKVDRSLLEVQSCVVVVSKMTADTFQLFAPQLALECEVYYNSRAQRWAEITDVDPKDMVFTIHWEDGTGEKAGLFFEAWASLKVVYRGKIELDMILWPPSERRGSPPQVPATL